ncbi:hypothetical protein L0222_17070 [bacterium]|nr:hypothetical protein [bacterium]
MLGERIGTEKGKVTGRRVLSNDDLTVRVETSQEGEGQILGVKYQSMATYWSIMRNSGTLFGEGQGVAMMENGETATWRGQGVGTPKTDGGVSFRGAIFFETSSSKLSALNSMAVVFEYEVDAAGNYSSQSWEWK